MIDGPTCPCCETMMLLLCLSPIPRMNVATQYPAHDLVKVSTAASYLRGKHIKHYNVVTDSLFF